MILIRNCAIHIDLIFLLILVMYYVYECEMLLIIHYQTGELFLYVI